MLDWLVKLFNTIFSNNEPDKPRFRHRESIEAVVELLDNLPDEWKITTYGGNLYYPPANIHLKMGSVWQTQITTPDGKILADHVHEDLEKRYVHAAIERWKWRRSNVASQRLVQNLTNDQQRRIIESRKRELTKELAYIDRELQK